MTRPNDHPTLQYQELYVIRSDELPRYVVRHNTNHLSNVLKLHLRASPLAIHTRDIGSGVQLQSHRQDGTQAILFPLWESHHHYGKHWQYRQFAHLGGEFPQYYARSHLKRSRRPQQQDSNAPQVWVYLYAPLASQYFQPWWAQPPQGIYKPLPNAVHDLKSRAVAVVWGCWP